MSDIKIGDIVEITKSRLPFYEKGQLGVVRYENTTEEGPLVEVQLSSGEIYGDGMWSVLLDDLIVLQSDPEGSKTPVKSIKIQNLTIAIPKGTTLLEGVFEGDNGDKYGVHILKV